MKRVLAHFNWKIALVSLIANMIAIGITALLLPGIDIVEPRLLSVAVLAVGLGLLNTFVKPILQVVTIRLLFVTYGLVLIITNTTILLLLSWIFQDSFTINGLLTAIVGGILIGLISLFLDYLFAITPPVGYLQAVQEEEVPA